MLLTLKPISEISKSQKYYLQLYECLTCVKTCDKCLSAYTYTTEKLHNLPFPCNNHVSQANVVADVCVLIHAHQAAVNSEHFEVQTE